jgi:hypothetical protein
MVQKLSGRCWSIASLSSAKDQAGLTNLDRCSSNRVTDESRQRGRLRAFAENVADRYGPIVQPDLKDVVVIASDLSP